MTTIEELWSLRRTITVKREACCDKRQIGGNELQYHAMAGELDGQKKAYGEVIALIDGRIAMISDYDSSIAKFVKSRGRPA